MTLNDITTHKHPVGAHPSEARSREALAALVAAGARPKWLVF